MIVFSTKAFVIVECIEYTKSSFQEVKENILRCPSGGTNMIPAFELAIKIIRDHPGMHTLINLMTDGESENPI